MINTTDDLRKAVPRYVAKILTSLRSGEIILSKDSGWGELEKGEALSVQDLMDPRARSAVAKMALELAKKEIKQFNLNHNNHNNNKTTSNNHHHHNNNHNNNNNNNNNSSLKNKKSIKTPAIQNKLKSKSNSISTQTPTSTRPNTPTSTSKSTSHSTITTTITTTTTSPSHHQSSFNPISKPTTPIFELLPDYPIQTRSSLHHQSTSNQSLSSTSKTRTFTTTNRQSDIISRHPIPISTESTPLDSTLPILPSSLIPPKPPTPPPPPPLPEKFTRLKTPQKIVSRPTSPPTIPRPGSRLNSNPTTRRNSTNTLTPTIVSLPYITLNIDSKPVKFLCDTGSMLNLMSSVVRDRLGLVMRSAPGTVMGVTGASLCEGVCEGLDGLGVIMFTPDNKSFCKARFVIGPTGQSDCILGMPFFVENRAEVKYVPGKGTLVSFETRRRLEEKEKEGNLIYKEKLRRFERRRITTIATEEADVLRGYDWPGQASQAHLSTHYVSLFDSNSNLITKEIQRSRSIQPKISIPSRPILPLNVVMKEIAQSDHKTSLRQPSFNSRTEQGTPTPSHHHHHHHHESYLHHSRMSSMDLRDSIPPFLDVRYRSRSRSGSSTIPLSSSSSSLISKAFLGSSHSYPTTYGLKTRTSLDQDLKRIELEKSKKEGYNNVNDGNGVNEMDEMIYKFLGRSNQNPNPKHYYYYHYQFE